MVTRRYTWNKDSKKIEQISGPPEDGWEKRTFKCSYCKNTFKRIVPRDSKLTDSPCCGEKSIIIIEVPHLLEKKKWKETGKNNLDSGIPFGEVPGDNDYKNINDPLSPKP